MDPLKEKSVVDDPGDESVDGFIKFAPEAGATGLVPGMRGNYVVLGLRPEYDFAGHDLPQQLGPNVGPWNR